MKFTFNTQLFVFGLLGLGLVYLGHPYIGVIVATIRLNDAPAKS